MNDSATANLIRSVAQVKYTIINELCDQCKWILYGIHSLDSPIFNVPSDAQIVLCVWDLFVTRSLLILINIMQCVLEYVVSSTVCKGSNNKEHPIASCNDRGNLRIRWPTDMEFGWDTAAVPDDFLSKLNKKILDKGYILDIILLNKTPPWVLYMSVLVLPCL